MYSLIFYNVSDYTTNIQNVHQLILIRRVDSVYKATVFSTDDDDDEEEELKKHI